MKNQIMFLFVLLFTVACSKSDESTVIIQDEIIGEWQINSFVINSCPDESDNIALTQSNEAGCLDVMGEISCVSIMFLENGQAEIHSGEAVEKLTYNVDEINSTINLCHESEDCQTFSLIDDGLYSEMDEEGCICTWGFKKM